MGRQPLFVFSPLPPAKNGIADYMYALLQELQTNYYDCCVFCADMFAEAPRQVRVRDEALAFRHLQGADRILHQIGNNPDHISVLQALRDWAGVVTLHDQNLHYLYEMAGTDAFQFYSGMAATSRGLGAVFARHWRDGDLKTAANYALFDMLHEVIAKSSAIIVHSKFARARLEAIYGGRAAERVTVIPHLALPPTMHDRALTRVKMGLPNDAFIILTCGFATRAKRLEWVMEALSEAQQRGLAFLWIHAGEERPEECNLSRYLQTNPELRRRSRIAGFVPEEDLTAYIAVCDVLVKLRFPSVGESSGILARGMAAGRCCIVSDTASYSELPKDAVVHIPIDRPIPHLVAALTMLRRNRELREAIASAARRIAATDWSPPTIAKQYRDVIDAAAGPRQSFAGPKPVRSQLDDPIISLELDHQTRRDALERVLDNRQGCCRVLLRCANLDELVELSLRRPRLLDELIPERVEARDVRIIDQVRTPCPAGDPSGLRGDLPSDAVGILLEIRVP